MKRLILTVACVALLAGCGVRPPQTSGDIVRDRQEAQTSQGVAEVGTPTIVNWRALRLAKFAYEREDETGLLTYTYIRNLNGDLIHFCDSMGYGIPGGTQISAPRAMQRYSVAGREGYPREWGVAELDQPEPNGLHMPSSASATRIICINPATGTADLVTAEENLTTYTWPHPEARGEPDRSRARPLPADPVMALQNVPAPTTP